MKNFFRKLAELMLFKSFIRARKIIDATSTDEIYEMRNSIQRVDLAIGLWILSGKINNIQKALIK